MPLRSQPVRSKPKPPLMLCTSVLAASFLLCLSCWCLLGSTGAFALNHVLPNGAGRGAAAAFSEESHPCHHRGGRPYDVLRYHGPAGSWGNHRCYYQPASYSEFVRQRGRINGNSASTALRAAGETRGPTEEMLVGTINAMQGSVGRGDVDVVDAIVCGGGPAGLLAAILLAQKYPHRTIRVYDRLSAPPSADDSNIWSDVAKFYLIGIGGRGQTALKRFGVWDEVLRRSVPVVGRKDWPPDSKEGVERIFTKEDKHVTTVVLPRDKLVGVLNQFILENYADRIQLNYGYEVRPVDWNAGGANSVLVSVSRCEDEIARLNPSSVKTSYEEQPDVLCDTENFSLLQASFLIAADGTVRTFANSMERDDRERLQTLDPLRRFLARPFRVRRYPDDNQRVYKTIPLKAPPGWRPDLNYSARSKDGRVNFDALPANTNGDYCGVLLLRKGDPMADSNVDPTKFRAFLDEYLPQFSELLDDETVASAAKKPVSYLPGFRYAGPRLYQGQSCVLLGDSIHTVKPYFGLGANSALEDVLVLCDALDARNGDVAAAIRDFSRLRAPEAKTLVRLSRELDRPGKVGFVTFILPLILDSIFFGLAPKLFRPNIITMLQREQYTFQQVARRKRLDRILQVSIIGGIFSTGYWLAAQLVKLLARWSGRGHFTIAVSIALSLVLLRNTMKVLSAFLVPNLSPGDVLARLSKKVINSRTFLTPLRKLTKESTNGETFLTTIGNKNKDDS